MGNSEAMRQRQTLIVKMKRNELKKKKIERYKYTHATCSYVHMYTSITIKQIVSLAFDVYYHRSLISVLLKFMTT